MSDIKWIEFVPSGAAEVYRGQLKDGRMFEFKNLYGRSAVRVSSQPTEDMRSVKHGITVYEYRHSDGIAWGPIAIDMIVSKSVKIWDRTVKRSDCEVYI